MKIIRSEKFKKWYEKLDLTQKVLIDVRVTRILVDKNFGDCKSLGSEIFELRFKNGLRVYYGFESNVIVLLLNGGQKSNKRSQSSDINQARQVFREYFYGK